MGKQLLYYFFMGNFIPKLKSVLVRGTLTYLSFLHQFGMVALYSKQRKLADSLLNFLLTSKPLK